MPVSTTKRNTFFFWDSEIPRSKSSNKVFLDNRSSYHENLANDGWYYTIFQMHSPEKYQLKPNHNSFKLFNSFPTKAPSCSSNYMKPHLSYSLNFYQVPHQPERSPCWKGVLSASPSVRVRPSCYSRSWRGEKKLNIIIHFQWLKSIKKLHTLSLLYVLRG